jgi:cold shock CspA family protein
LSKDVKDFGTIAYWKETDGGGFGFICGDGGCDRDIFFHASKIKIGTPKRGARASFYISPDLRRPDRLQATDIDILP